MAETKHKNKVVYDGEVLIDLTADTITADKLASGITAHDKSGESITVHAFCGDGYYKAATWGSPSKTSCTFAVSDGKLTGLPTLNGGTLIAVCGI